MTKNKSNFNKVLKPDLVVARYKPANPDDDTVMTRFLDKHYQAELLLQAIYLRFKDEEDTEYQPVIEMAKQNFIISLISELEIFLKGMIKRFDWANEDGYSNLLSAESINLYEAHRMFVSGNVSREAIIADHYSFQNISQIENVFSQLTGNKFLHEIELSKAFNVNGKLRSFQDRMTTLKVKDWRKHLVLGYERRHIIIHEGFTDNLEMNEVREFGSMLINLMLTITYYCNSTQKTKA